jgi:hypothetical protein
VSLNYESIKGWMKAEPSWSSYPPLTLFALGTKLNSHEPFWGTLHIYLYFYSHGFGNSIRILLFWAFCDIYGTVLKSILLFTHLFFSWIHSYSSV